MNFINILSNEFVQFLVSLLGIVFLSGIYFLFTYASRKKFRIIVIFEKYLDFALAIAIGAFAVLFNYFIKTQLNVNQVLVYFDFAFFVALLAFQSWKVNLLLIPSIAISYFLIWPSNTYSEIWMLTYAAISLFTLFKIFKEINRILWIMLAFLFTALIPIITFYIFYNNSVYKEQVPVTIVLTLILIGISSFALYLVNGFFHNAWKLRSGSKMEFENFLKQAVYKEEILSIINLNKIQHARLFVIEVESKTKIQEIERELIALSRKIKEKSNCAFFKINNNQFGIFQIDKINPRLIFAPHEGIEIINELNNFREKQHHIKIGITSVVYGINSNDLDELIQYCDFGLQRKKYIAYSTNYVFSAKDLLMFQSENYDVQILGSTIRLNDIETFSQKIIKGNQIIGYHLDYSFTNFRVNQKQTIEKLNVLNLRSTFNRLIAWKMLSEAKLELEPEQKIFFEYDVNYLSSTFSTLEFEQKIGKLNILLDQLVMIIDLSLYTGDQSNLIYNLTMLNKKGVMIGVSNFDEYEQLKPFIAKKVFNYIVLDENYINVNWNNKKIIKEYLVLNSLFCEKNNLAILIKNINNNYQFDKLNKWNWINFTGSYINNL